MARGKYKNKLSELKLVDGGDKSNFFLKRAIAFSVVLALVVLSVIIAGVVLFLTMTGLDLALTFAILYLPTAIAVIGVAELIFSILFFRAFVFQLRLKKRPRAIIPLVIWGITQIVIITAVLIVYI